MIHTNDLKAIAIDAGEICMRSFGDRSSYQIDLKSDKTFVTSVDRDLNQYLKKNLLALMPKADWISEEDIDLHKKRESQWAWIVDPIDGTGDFISNQKGFAISIALAKNHQIVAGCVYCPAYAAGGVKNINEDVSFWNLEPKEPAASMSDVQISISRREKRKGLITAIELDFKNIIYVGSVAHKMLRVAAGVDDAYLTVEAKSEWDFAAGYLLLESVNKKMRRWDDLETKFNSPTLRIPSGFICGEERLVDQIYEKYKNNLKAGSSK